MDDQTRDWLLEHHQRSYRAQAERADKIRDRISFLVTPFTLLGGGIVYVWGNYLHGWKSVKSLLFYLPLTLSSAAFLIALLVALYCLSWGFKYLSIPPPGALQDDAKKISEYQARFDPQLEVLGEVKSAMMDRYCDAADFNFRVNVRRTNLVLRSTQAGVVSFALLLATLPTFFTNKLRAESPPTIIIDHRDRIEYGRRKQECFDRNRADPKHRCPATRRRACVEGPGKADDSA